MSKKSLLIAITLCFLSFSIKAKYKPLSLTYMIGTADLVIYGEIEDVETGFFTLKINGEAFGDYNGATIRVKQFKDWTCAQRWTKYEKGQNVLLFLKKNKDNEWEILSGGDEGEMPIVDGYVYLAAYYAYDMPFVNYERKGLDGKSTYYKFQSYELYGAVYQGFMFKLDEFINAVSSLRSCFQYVWSDDGYTFSINQLCSNEKLEEIKKKSKFHNWLIETILKN